MKMKFLFLFLFLGVSQATLRDTRHDDLLVRRDNLIRGDRFLDRNFRLKRDLIVPLDGDKITTQIEIIKLLKNINHLNTDRLVLDISTTYRLEDNVDRFWDKKCVLDLIHLYRTDGFLKRDKVFNILNELHRYEVKIITKVLIHARDTVDFVKVACWLRNRVNGAMFVYALSVAVKNRDDCIGVVLPPIYEIVPMKFFKNKVIQKATQLKMQGGEIFDERYARTLGIEMVDRNVFVIKTDYTGVNINNFGEDKLTYFTEDIGLNANYFMAQITTPFWLDYDTIMTKRHNNYRRGEFQIFIYEQLLARYYMERLCNGLGEIPTLKLNTPIKTGYNPSLRHHNGLEYSIRPNNFVLNTADNFWELKTFKDYERRIRDAIDRGYIWTEDGKVVTLRRPEDLDKLGNLILCNRLSVNDRYIFGVRIALELLGNRRVIDDNTGITPSVLESYETMLRDPVFYQLLKRISFNVYKFTSKLRPYTFDELIFKGVKINDVKVDKLVTFFDTFDADITNVVNRDVREMKINTEDIIIKARQVRLNHVPFNIGIDITSDTNTDVVIKTFLGPKFDSTNRRINLDENRINFLLLDKQSVTLKHGRNTITRNSRHFNLVTDDLITTRKLTNHIGKCFKGETECFTTVVKHSVLIPDRLVLPKGTNGGMTFQLFVTVTPVFDLVKDKTSDRCEGLCVTDTFRYPLDRRILHVKEFLNIDNFFIRDVVIIHKEEILDKYTGIVKVKDVDELTSDESLESVETLRTGRNLVDRMRLGHTVDSKERFWDTRNLKDDAITKDKDTTDRLCTGLSCKDGIMDKTIFVKNKLCTGKFCSDKILRRGLDSIENLSLEDIRSKDYLKHLMTKKTHSDIDDSRSLEMDRIMRKNSIDKFY